MRAEGFAGAFGLSPKAIVFEAMSRSERDRGAVFASAISTGVGMSGDRKALESLMP